MAPLYSFQIGIAKDSVGKDWGGPGPDDIWIIRQFTCTNGNSESSGVIFQLLETITGVIFVQVGFDVDLPVSAIGTFTWTGRIVIPYGQEVSWRSFSSVGASGLDVYIGGYRLTGP